MKLTECEQARLSLKLQQDSHEKQQRLIEERWKRTKREDKPRTLQHVSTSELSPRCPVLTQSHPASHPPEREYDTWLYLLKNKNPSPQPCGGSKTLKDDKTRLEEQQTTIDDLRRHVERLLTENQQLSKENQRLQAENSQLRKERDADTDFIEAPELWELPVAKNKTINIPALPPLEMPTQEIPLEELPPLELPEDIQQELQELLDNDAL
ncbi:hypothetical protein DNTS_023154 [Danionella cerebrum]|nr:hypothetical protein DNTS_023154 [Danionella translucida]